MRQIISESEVRRLVGKPGLAHSQMGANGITQREAVDRGFNVPVQKNGVLYNLTRRDGKYLLLSV